MEGLMLRAGTPTSQKGRPHMELRKHLRRKASITDHVEQMQVHVNGINRRVEHHAEGATLQNMRDHAERLSVVALEFMELCNAMDADDRDGI